MASERVVAHELALVRGLACNDAKRRNRLLRAVRKWLLARDNSSFEFTEYDFTRLWKGLFFCVWMSDKPLVQEELCENVAKLFECFENVKTSMLFYRCFLKTMAQNWFGIDQHRIDKFLMLVRRVTRGILYCVKKHKWSIEATDEIERCFVGEDGLFASPTPADCRMALGLQLHLVDCWMEEVSKVSEGKISSEVVTRLTKPFATYLCNGTENRLCSNIMKHVFIHLIQQTDLGIEYHEKELAWRNAGFPTGNIDAMEKIDVSEDESDDIDCEPKDESERSQALDPRAGNVDTILPQLNVDGNEIARMLQSLVPQSQISCCNRTRMKDLIKSFETLSTGEFPLKAKDIILPQDPQFKLPKTAKAAMELISFEREIEEKFEERELRGLNKRQKRRFMSKQRKKNLNPSEEPHEPPPKKAKTNVSSGTWHVEDTRHAETHNSKPADKINNKIKKSACNNTNNGVKKINHINGDDTEIQSKTKKKAKGPLLINNAKDTSGMCSENGLNTKKINPVVKLTPLRPNAILQLNDEKTSDTPKRKSTEPIASTPIVNSKSHKMNKSLTNSVVKSSKENDETPKSGKTPKPAETPKSNKKLKLGENTKSKEVEIIIRDRKKLNTNNLNKSDSAILKNNKLTKKLSHNMSATFSPSKKVNIDLAKNKSHAVVDYFKSVKQSPTIPFDGEKKPSKTSLKPNAMPSPVNPFYKHKLKMLK